MSDSRTIEVTDLCQSNCHALLATGEEYELDHNGPGWVLYATDQRATPEVEAAIEAAIEAKLQRARKPTRANRPGG